MILPFSTHWPKTMPAHLSGKPTDFVEKIWESILQTGIQVSANEFIEYGRSFLPKNYIVGRNEPKRHTFRSDEKDRWHAGRDIHFVINNRSKNQKQFAPVVKCVSTQKAEIIYTNKSDAEFVCINDIQIEDRLVRVEIDGKELTIQQIKEISINDGFDTVEDFFAWFNTDFTGKIIHWTNLKY